MFYIIKASSIPDNLTIEGLTFEQVITLAYTKLTPEELCDYWNWDEIDSSETYIRYIP